MTKRKRGLFYAWNFLILFILCACAVRQHPVTENPPRAPYSFKGWVFMGMLPTKKEGPRALYISEKHSFEKGMGKAAVMILPGEKRLEALRRQIFQANRQAERIEKGAPQHADRVLKVLLVDNAQYYIVETRCEKEGRQPTLEYKTGTILNYKVVVHPNTIEARIYRYLCASNHP